MKDHYLVRAESVLNCEQVQRLVKVMEETIEIHGGGNFPTLQMPLRELIREVRKRVQERGLTVTHVKLNGSAASHILASCDLPFNDIDLIFGVDLSAKDSFDDCKSAVLDSLLEFLPFGASKTISHAALKDAYVRKLVKVAANGHTVEQKAQADVWSLISLNNDCGRYTELKFVHRMRRQYEFSVDSFQIYLDSLLAYFDEAIESPLPESHDVKSIDLQNINPPTFSDSSCASGRAVRQESDKTRTSVRRDPELDSEDPGYSSDRTSELGDLDQLFCDVASRDIRESSTVPDTEAYCDQLSIVSSGQGSLEVEGEADEESFRASRMSRLETRKNPVRFPPIIAESVYGDYHEALRHVNGKLIDTRRPEEIRGGGLLKYANLIIRGYRPARPRYIRLLERYMCSRFFIDFSDIDQQAHKLQSYIANHFNFADYRARYDYLHVLYRVVNESTICLMNHERRLSLQMINSLAQAVTNEFYSQSYQLLPPTLVYLPFNNTETPCSLPSV